MPLMRAKLRVSSVSKLGPGAEVLEFKAVAANSYPADGRDENNSYAFFTPQADLRMVIQNPDLFGQFEPGDVFYVDFTEEAKASSGDRIVESPILSSPTQLETLPPSTAFPSEPPSEPSDPQT